LIKKEISEGTRGIDQLLTLTGGEKKLNEFVDGRHVDCYKKRQRIFSEGNHPIRLYFVQRGKVKLFKTNDDGKELIIRIVNEGEFFGYTAMFEGCVYKESADALEDSEIATIPRNEFEELLHCHSDVSRKFIKMLASDISEKEEQLLHIAYNSLRRKVADALLSVHKTYHTAPDGDIYLSRENLAALAGTATESLIRTLTSFKAEHLIDIKDGRITILNYPKLDRMAN
jgi:CRP-like cAMP-binding protein